MRKVILVFIILYLICIPVSADEFTAPTAPPEVQEYMPKEESSFINDLLYIIRQALPDVLPTFYSALKTVILIICICMMTGLLRNISNLSVHAVDLASAISIGTLLLASSRSFISLAVKTVESITEYGKLLFPVMTAALAAEGGIGSSTALYTGTVIFNTVLTSTITKLIIPMLYAYLSVSLVLAIYSSSILKTFKDFFKWLMTWTLKICIYVFTGYLGITKVITGTTDAAALKATKLTISGMVPVIGGMISDASETVLLSIGVMKNAAGIYGVLAIISICIVPFITILLQCTLLRLCEGLCGLLGNKTVVDIAHEFTYSMELLLAVTGTICILLLITTVCYMKGVT